MFDGWRRDGAPRTGWRYGEMGSGGGRMLRGWIFHVGPDGERWIEWMVFHWLSVWVLVNPGEARR